MKRTLGQSVKMEEDEVIELAPAEWEVVKIRGAMRRFMQGLEDSQPEEEKEEESDDLVDSNAETEEMSAISSQDDEDDDADLTPCTEDEGESQNLEDPDDPIQEFGEGEIWEDYRNNPQELAGPQGMTPEEAVAKYEESLRQQHEEMWREMEAVANHEESLQQQHERIWREMFGDEPRILENQW